MRFLFGILASLFVALTWVLSWEAAHVTVAKECQRLGAFYVGNSVFECKEKEDV